jgi:hypothetical protein
LLLLLLLLALPQTDLTPQKHPKLNPKSLTGHALPLLWCESLVEGVLVDECDGLVLQPVHDEAAHSGLAAGGAAGDAYEEGAVSTAPPASKLKRVVGGEVCLLGGC